MLGNFQFSDCMSLCFSHIQAGVDFDIWKYFYINIIFDEVVIISPGAWRTSHILFRMQQKKGLGHNHLGLPQKIGPM